MHEKIFTTQGLVEDTLLASIVEHTADAILSVSMDGIIRSWNPSAEKIFGYSPDEIIGGPLQVLIPEDKQLEFADMLKQLSQGNSIKNRNTVRLSKDGNPVPVSATISPIRDKEGNIGGFSSILRDISEREEHKREILKGERFLSSVFSSIQDGLTVIDKNFNVLRVNQTMERWFPHSLPLVGRKCYEAYYGSEKRCKPCRCFDCLISGEMGQMVTKTHIKPKGERWLENHYYPLINTENGETEGVIIHSRDITEKKKVETEMSRLQSFKLIGEMAAGIGHEVRNPMTTVRGFLQMLMNKEDLIRYSEYFQLMIQELDRANGIITDYLSLAKDKTVNIKLQDLNSIIETIFPLMMTDAVGAGKNIELELAKIPLLPVDEKEMRQLILNLALNGLEAMPAGRSLTISTYAEGAEVILAVKDQGPGIAPEIVDKLGTPFVSTKEKGTGLGLAVCFSIAARHNAKIKVETGSKGTTFLVKFRPM